MQDNYSLWAAHDDEQEERLKSLPVCSECGEHIQQEYAVKINGDWYCDNCLDDMREEIEE